jgi:hypothetical protein
VSATIRFSRLFILLIIPYSYRTGSPDHHGKELPPKMRKQRRGGWRALPERGRWMEAYRQKLHSFVGPGLPCVSPVQYLPGQCSLIRGHQMVCRDYGYRHRVSSAPRATVQPYLGPDSLGRLLRHKRTAVHGIYIHLDTSVHSLPGNMDCYDRTSWPISVPGLFSHGTCQ